MRRCRAKSPACRCRRRHHRQVERVQFCAAEPRCCCRVAAGAGIHGDEAIDAAVRAHARPARLGDVVVDDAARRVHTLGTPSGIAQRSDEEAHAFLECHVDPLLHAVKVVRLLASISALNPTGLEVSVRMRRRPARNSWPCTKVSEMGWMTPRPPASLTAATSSGFEHGYIGPLISGTAMPAAGERWRINVLDPGASAPWRVPPRPCRRRGTPRSRRGQFDTTDGALTWHTAGWCPGPS